MNIIRFVSFIISFIGLCLFTSKKFNLNIYFTPIVSISFISIVLIVFGIIIDLNIISKIVLIIGFLGLVWSICRIDLKIDLLFIIMLIITFLLIIFRTKGQFLASYDNFTHWATVVKTMALSNHLPNVSDYFIDFKTYPLGESIWLYYVSNIVKNSEGIYMFAKEVMIISCIMPLFYFACRDKKKIENIIIIFIYLIFSSTYILSISHLQVDNLLPLFSISTLIIMINSKNNKWIKCILLIMLCQIKNSGIIFVVIILIIYALKNKDIKKTAKHYFLPAIISFLLWNFYVNLRFPNVSNSVQSLSIDYFVKIFLEKDLDNISNIFVNIVKTIFNISIDNKTGIIVPVVICALSIICFEKKERIKIICTINLCYFGYVFLVFLMYVFSMPLTEALLLSCFERYMLSITLFIIGVFIYGFIKYNNRHRLVNILSSLLIISLLYTDDYSSLYNVHLNDEEKRVKFAKMLQYYNVESDKTYLIIDNQPNDSHNTFSYWSIRYDLWSEKFYLISDIDDIKKNIYDWNTKYDYLIINTSTQETNIYLDFVGYADYMGMDYIVFNSNDFIPLS